MTITRREWLQQILPAAVIALMSLAAGGYLGYWGGGTLAFGGLGDYLCSDVSGWEGLECIFAIWTQLVISGGALGAALGAWAGMLVVRKRLKIYCNPRMSLVGSSLMGSVMAAAIWGLSYSLQQVELADALELIVGWSIVAILSVCTALACTIGALVGSAIGQRRSGRERE